MLASTKPGTGTVCSTATPRPGTHAFSGEFMPSKRQLSGQQTFSVGIFEWLAKANGRGVKRGAVKVRVKGPIHTEQAVLDKAREIAHQLDTGSYQGPRTVAARTSA